MAGSLNPPPPPPESKAVGYCCFIVVETCRGCDSRSSLLPSSSSAWRLPRPRVSGQRGEELSRPPRFRKTHRAHERRAEDALRRSGAEMDSAGGSLRSLLDLHGDQPEHLAQQRSGRGQRQNANMFISFFLLLSFF